MNLFWNDPFMNTLPNSAVADFFKLYKHSKKVDCTFYIGFSDIANSIIGEGAHIHVLPNQFLLKSIIFMV